MFARLVRRAARPFTMRQRMLSMLMVWLTLGLSSASIANGQGASNNSPQFEARLLVLLTPTDKARPDAATLATLQKGHLANFRKMAEAGFLLVAGPTQAVTDTAPPLAGTLIFKAEDNTAFNTIQSMLSEDPMIKAGLLKAHTYRFMFERGDNLYERRERKQGNGTG